jgi:hypothetical protein
MPSSSAGDVAVREGYAFWSAGGTGGIYQQSDVFIFCGRQIVRESRGEFGGGPVVKEVEAVV